VRSAASNLSRNEADSSTGERFLGVGSLGVNGMDMSETESSALKALKEKDGLREAKNSKVDWYRSLRFKLAIGSMAAERTTKHQFSALLQT
jgi:hypothetical protein